jgi:2-methylcitrate dehydratase PrpD
MNGDIVRDLADHAARMEFADLPRQTIDKAKMFILDTVGCAIAGTNAPGCIQVSDLFREFGGKPESCVIGSGFRLPSLHAAFVNGMLSHALDFDDVHDEAVIHSYAPVLPATLALAEARKEKTGRDLILATIIGADIVCRLGLAFDHSSIGFFPTSVCGALASAAASAKLIDLDIDGILNALGIAYNNACGNRQCIADGALTKRMLPASAAEAGVRAALFAERGITGARNVLEGTYGFFEVYAGGCFEREVITSDLGIKFACDALSLKPFPGCRLTHPATEATLNIIRREQISPEAIEAIDVQVPNSQLFSMVTKPFALTGDPQVNAQFSIAYTVAAAANKGGLSLEDFEEHAIRDVSLYEMTKKIIVRKTLDAPSNTAILPVIVEIKTKDGRWFSEELRLLKGQPQKPLSRVERLSKFKECAKYSQKHISNDRIDRIVEMIMSLDAIDNMREVTDLIKV